MRSEDFALQLATNDHYDFYILWTIEIMVFNATFNNISVVSWQSVLLLEKTGVTRENHRPVASH